MRTLQPDKIAPKTHATPRPAVGALEPAPEPVELAALPGAENKKKSLNLIMGTIVDVPASGESQEKASAQLAKFAGAQEPALPESPAAVPLSEDEPEEVAALPALAGPAEPRLVQAPQTVQEETPHLNRGGITGGVYRQFSAPNLKRPAGFSKRKRKPQFKPRYRP